MKLSKVLTGLFLASVATFALSGCGNDEATANNSGETPLNVQFVPTNNDGTMEARGSEFGEYLSERLGRPVNVTVATDFNTIVEGMVSGQIDLGIMPPAAFVQARERGGAKAILTSRMTEFDRETGETIEGEYRSSFRAEILVRKDSNIHELTDLIGGNIGTLSAASASGFIYPVVEMMNAGIDPLSDVSLVTINDIPSAITGVLNGQLDAAFAFEGARFTFNGAFDDHDLPSELRVLHLSDGVIPNDAIAVQPDMDADLIAKIQEIFMNMSETQEGRDIIGLWGHIGYAPANDEDYDTIKYYIGRAAELN